jgi:succinate-semialdehyde dehydrogenase/glutarate-semialdehyde dehydrogenase
MQARIKELSETITSEMGKPIVDAEKEAKKAIYFCDYYSQNYEPLLPQFIKTEAKKHTVVKYLPIGIVYNMVPFNFPLYLNVKGGLPSLLIGNTLLVRNADSCPRLGRLIEEVMVNAGFSNGEYQNVYTAHDQLDQIFEYPTVQGVCFTGSSRSGGLIAEKAGKHLVKSVLELGGNDPFVVLEDGDINEAVS